MKAAATSTDDLLERFDAGEDVDEYFDMSAPEFPNRETKRVNVDFPSWMVRALDTEAARVGVNRQAVIKMWIAERLDSASALSA